MSKSCDLCTIVIDDSKYFDCDICGVKSVHYDCLTVKIDGDPISCGIHWKCKSCASLSVTDMLANVLERLKRLDTLCADVADLKSVVKKTIKPRNFANVSRKTRTGGGPPQLVDDKRSESTSSQSSSRVKRSRTDSEDLQASNAAHVDPGTQPELSEFQVVIPRKKKPVFGTNRSGGTAFAPPKPPPRRHVYIGRLNKEVDAERIRAFCNENNTPLLHIRELSGHEAKTRSYHCVFVFQYSAVDSPDFWPENVIVDRYRLNEEARSWLRSLRIH